MTAAGTYGLGSSAKVFRSFARAIGIAERGGLGQIGRTITGCAGVFSRVHDIEDGGVEEAEVDEPEEPPQPTATTATTSTDATRDPRLLMAAQFPVGSPCNQRSFANSSLISARSKARCGTVSRVTRNAPDQIRTGDLRLERTNVIGSGSGVAPAM
jgi:hypothetical protein